MACPSAFAFMFAKSTFMSLAQNGTNPQRIKSRLRSLALGSNRTIGKLSVGAPFHVGAKFGGGRSGGIENAILISMTSEERRTRPHMVGAYLGKLPAVSYSTCFTFPRNRSQ